MSTTSRPRAVLSALLSASVLFVSGCALQQTDSTLPVLGAAGIHGHLMGGQQPVSNSSISLIQTGNTGYGNAGSPSLLASTTTDANGNFSLPAYTCPTPTTPTLLQAQGGNPGLVAGTNNTAILLVAVTGPCGLLTSSTFVSINEITTVAAAYAMRPFTVAGNVGTSATNAIGLSSAMLTADLLVDTASGSSPGGSVPAGLSIPFTTINSLANSLAACVNSTGPGSTPCASLFSATGVSNSGTTANVFNIAVAIANAPATNVQAIYNVGAGSPPFQPALASAPADWSIGINHINGNLNFPQTALDIDVSGNVWVTTTAGFRGTVEEISSQGALLQTNLFNGVVNVPLGLAIEPSANLIVTSSTPGNASVIRFAPNGTILYQNTSNLLGTPAGVAIDGSNNAIVADPGVNKVFSFSPNATVNFSPAEVNGALYPGLDVNQNVYVTNTGSQVVDRFSNGLGGIHTTTGVNGTGGHLSFDNFANVYVTNTNGFLNELNSGGAPAAFTNASVGTQGVRVSGLGTIWVGATSGTSRVLVYAPNYSSLLARLVANTNNGTVTDIGIDRSGNVWLANGASGGLYEVVGAAAPVATPISVAASPTNLQGQRP